MPSHVSQSSLYRHTDSSSLLFYFFFSGCPQRLPPLSARSRPRPRIGTRSCNPPSPLTEYIRIPALIPHTCPSGFTPPLFRPSAHQPGVHVSQGSAAQHKALIKSQRMPRHLYRAYGAQFALSRAEITRRPIEFYARYAISRRSRADLAQISRRSRADLAQISCRFISACMRCVSPTSEIAISGYVDGWSHRTTRCTVQDSCRCGERTPRRRR